MFVSLYHGTFSCSQQVVPHSVMYRLSIEHYKLHNQKENLELICRVSHFSLSSDYQQFCYSHQSNCLFIYANFGRETQTSSCKDIAGSPNQTQPRNSASN